MGVKNLLRTGQFFGLQYIYQTLTNSDGADPIDYPAIVENPAEFELVATDAATGKPVYFTKDDMKQDDYRASWQAVPCPLCAVRFLSIMRRILMVDYRIPFRSSARLPRDVTVWL